MDEALVRAAAQELRGVLDGQIGNIDRQVILLNRDQALLALGLIDATILLLQSGSQEPLKPL